MGTKVSCNVENVLKLADALEAGKIKEGRKRVGFNMDMWHGSRKELGQFFDDLSGHKCGTIACIGGSTEILFKTVEPEVALGLTPVKAHALFYPTGPFRAHWRRIPLEAAVEVLRHLAKTGKIDWRRAIKLYPLVAS